MKNGEKNETDPRQIADAFNDYFIDISKNIQEKIAPTRKHFSDYLKQPCYLKLQTPSFFDQLK